MLTGYSDGANDCGGGSSGAQTVAQTVLPVNKLRPGLRLVQLYDPQSMSDKVTQEFMDEVYEGLGLEPGQPFTLRDYNRVFLRKERVELKSIIRKWVEAPVAPESPKTPHAARW